nr:tetratricopeptide repeat protein [uncultured Roseateles sp.]
MVVSKIGRNDPCTCGSGKKYKHCCQARNETPALNTPAVDDRTRLALHDAMNHLQRGNLDAVLTICNHIFRTNPSQPDALHLRGMVKNERAQYDDALKDIERAIAIGANTSMYSNRGLVLRKMGRLQDAVASYRKSLEMNGQQALVHCNLGILLSSMNQWDEAKLAYASAIQIDPNNMEIYRCLGICQLSSGDIAAAVLSFKKCCELAPNTALAHTNLASALWAQGKLDDAISEYRTALNIDPANIQGLENLAVSLLMMNEIDEACEVFERVFQSKPGMGSRIQRDLILPHVVRSREELSLCRAEFERKLDVLIEDCEPMAAVDVRMRSSSIFRLAFHGKDDLPVMQKLASFYAKLFPGLDFKSPHLENAEPIQARHRIGFFSTYIHDHSVSRCFSDLICSLANDPRFEVFLITMRAPDKAAALDPYAGFTGKIIVAGADYLAARTAISSLKLDILAYQDIGMEEMSYFLAFSRLARFQCVLGGHPVTTGIPNMDYFVSSALCEPEHGQDHYTEKLVSMAGLTVVYQHPVIPEIMKTRHDFGLPLTGALYVCPMMLQKIHPDFDEAVARILEADPDGHVVFFEHKNARWHAALQQRLDSSIPSALRSRVIFLPWLVEYADFIAINALADVVLDTFHFGIGSTAIATYAVNTPVVTWPGAYARGRAALAYCNMLELPECVASDLDDYAAKAVALARDKPLREQVKSKIVANKNRLFDNKDPVKDYADLFLEWMASDHSARTSA